jgi:hypothetical protein
MWRHPARLDERVEGAQGHLERRLGVIEVRVAEVEAIGLPALERRVRLALDRLGAQAADRS